MFHGPDQGEQQQDERDELGGEQEGAEQHLKPFKTDQARSGEVDPAVDADHESEERFGSPDDRATNVVADQAHGAGLKAGWTNSGHGVLRIGRDDGSCVRLLPVIDETIRLAERDAASRAPAPVPPARLPDAGAASRAAGGARPARGDHDFR